MATVAVMVMVTVTMTVMFLFSAPDSTAPVHNVLCHPAERGRAMSLAQQGPCPRGILQRNNS
eukprot:11062742-Lingulodinium_polyedra.AAC.1